MQQSKAYREIASYLDGLERFGIKPGLERIRAMMERLGNPHLEYPVVLVGGTNGKGSVVEFIGSILHSAGHKVGIYTSPHLYLYNERIRVVSPDLRSGSDLFAGQIQDGELLRLLNEVRLLAKTIETETNFGHPTAFEVLTAIGFKYFAERKVDIGVIEVGLGGRWDATNVAEPKVSVITNVSLDHTDRLGHTVAEIVREKVEIVRPGKALVTPNQDPAVIRPIAEFCHSRSVLLRVVPIESTLRAARLSRETLQRLVPFQQINAAVAVATVQELEDGWKVPSAIRQGIAEARLPCRFEFVCQSPSIILDSANNVAGMIEVRKALLRLKHRRNFILVLGISGDKDVEGMVEAIAPIAQTIIATQGQNLRASAAERIAEAARRYSPDVRIHVPVSEAVRQATNMAEMDDVICITGSIISLLGEVDRDELKGLCEQKRRQLRSADD